MQGLITVLIIVFLSSFNILLSNSLAPPGTIQRLTKQQLLASLPPSEHDTASSQMFLTSPSAKYTVYLLRRDTSLGAGGFGNDFCYLQVQDSAAGVSVWESDCTSVSNVNTCTLLFSEAGLEIFDGSQSAWDNDVDGEDLETLVLMDSGDMHIRDKEGDVVWKASDNPVVNQNCGSIGAPGFAPDHPTFGSPIHDDDTGPFGQPAVDSPVVQQPDQLGASVQPPHQLGTSSPAPGEENQLQLQEPAAASPEEQAQQEPTAASPEEQKHSTQQEPAAASPEEQEHSTQQEPTEASPGEQEPQQLQQPAAASPEEQEHPTQQEPAASPGEQEPQQLQQPAAASPEVKPEHQHHQQQLGSSSLNQHPIGARNQQPYSSLNQQQQQQSINPVGVAAHQQPLIDNTPFDSGSSRDKPSEFGVTLFFLITTLMTYNFLLG